MRVISISISDSEDNLEIVRDVRGRRSDAGRVRALGGVHHQAGGVGQPEAGTV